MTEKEIQGCVMRAWKNRERVYTQDNPLEEQRITYRGIDLETGYLLEIWQNKNSGIV